MSTTYKVELGEKVQAIGAVSFLRAELAGDRGSPFAIVYFAIDGQEQPQGLRLDVSKRVFLDATGISLADERLEEIAPLVVAAISEEAYSSDEIAERVAQARSTGWEGLALFDCKVQDNDLRKLLGEPGVERLRALYLGVNQLSTLPPEIGRLTALMELDLRVNQLSTLPPEIGRLTALTRLDLSENELSALPPEIGQLTALTVLNLQRNRLSMLPPEFGALTALTELDLSANQLCTLPPEIGQLTALTVLFLGANQLSALPPEVGQLFALRGLYLFENQLSTLPPEIGQLLALTNLYLCINQLSALPPEIGQLIALRELDLDRNQLSALPPEIGQLIALTMLDLSANQLSALPPEIGRLSALTKLYLHGNDGLGIPPEILGPTWRKHSRPAWPSAILDYYFRTRTEATRPLNEVKILLVGEAAVGKTSLVQALLHNTPCRPGERMTEGIAIDLWEIAGKRAGEKIRLNVWDFGGQEIMHATHQFFLTRRSLYLLVLDARQDEKQCRLEYWLRLAQSRGGDSPVIVVINKIDDGRLRVDRTGLVKKYAPNLKGFVETSCEKGLTGIAELRQRIEKEVNALEHVDSKLPISYFAVKEDLEAQGKRTPHMTWADYQRICAKHGVSGGEQQERLGQFLHDLGVILSFRDDDRLAGLGVLSPQWVTSGVYAIITSERLNNAGGVLCRDCLEQILPPSDYPPDKRDFIIEMMKKFELCFAFDREPGEQWLIPGLLDKERPDFAWDETEAVRFEYRYAVLPGSVIWRFIVRNHTMLDKQNPIYWRSGVVLDIDGAHALVIADEEDRRLSVSVRSPLPVLRRSALTHVRMELEHIHGNLSRIEAKGKVPLPDRPEVAVEYHHLLKLEERNRVEFLPEGADREYRVADLLEGVSGKGQRARERQRQQDSKDWHRSRDIVRDEVFISYSHKDKKWLEKLTTTLAPLTRDGELQIWDDTRIRPGDKWREEIRQALARAKIGVLLVSPEFLASEFIAKAELPPLLDAAENEGLTLFWIPVQHSLYKHTAIEKYQAACDPGKPLASLAAAAAAKALVQIGEALKKAYEAP